MKTATGDDDNDIDGDGAMGDLVQEECANVEPSGRGPGGHHGPVLLTRPV